MLVMVNHSPVKTASPDRSTSTGGPLSVSVARTLDDVEALRPAWETLQGPQVNTEIDVFLAMARFHPAVIRPHVMLVERDGVPEGLIVGHVRRNPLGRKAGPSVRSLSVLAGGFLGRSGDELIAVGVSEVEQALARREATIGIFRLITVNSPEQREIGSGLPRRRRQLTNVQPHTRLDLGPTLEETLCGRSAKVRENARRALRRVEALGDRADVRVFRAPGEVEAFFDHVDSVAPSTHQYPGAYLYRGAPAERELARLGTERGWFRGYVLLVDGEPAAFWTGFAYKGVFGWGGRTGYDRRLRRYEPGTVLLMRMIDDLCRDPDVHVLDFGQGGEQYKRRLATRTSLVGDLRIYAGRPASASLKVVDWTAETTRRLTGRAPHFSTFVPALGVTG
jgi:CelD/BcsL family acetyltransferase involved in cellulose biosynthesis